MQKIAPYLLISIAPLCWAGDIVLAKSVSSSIPPFTLVFWRWLLAAVIMLPLSYKHVIKDKEAIIKSWGILSLLSFFGASGFITLLYTGVHFTSAKNVGLLQSTVPGFIALMCFFLYGEKSTKTQYLGLFLCMLGASYVVFQGDLTNIRALFVKTKGFSLVKGDFLILIGVIMYGLYSALLPKSPRISPFSFIFCLSSLGAIALLPFYLWEVSHLGSTALNLNVLFSVLYVAIFPSIVAYWCWLKGVQAIGPSSTGMFIGLLPVFVAALSVPFLDEPLKVYHLIGMCSIFSGMILFNKNKSSINT
jgi:drug/metabolite transporter (DMT)-like permease